MAITPRTIFSSAAPATVAAASLLAFTAVGTVAYMSSADRCGSKTVTERAQPADGICDGVRSQLGADQSQWSEASWVRYATCFENRGRSHQTVQAAKQGLRHYPSSEYLYYMAGYHQLTMDRHQEAVQTLKTGLDRVGSYGSVNENNLAWASLWAPRELSLDKAESLYRSALSKRPRNCAYLHTGLWVEYAAAQQSSGVEKFDALRRFESLRGRYESCLSRLNHADWRTFSEIGGAAVLFDLVDETDRQNRLATSDDVTSGDALLKDVARKMRTSTRGVSVDELCSDAMPLATTHHACTERVGQALQKVAADNNRKARKAKGASGGSGGCPAATY